MILEIGLALATLVLVLHLYISWNFNYFKDRGIPYLKPKPFFGNMASVLLQKKTFFEFDKDIYNYFKSKGHKIAGYFEGSTPVIWIQDLDILKSVLVKDFDHFTNRRGLGLEDDKYFKNILFGARDQEWRDLRIYTTPAFTSGKMKKIFCSMQECGDNLVEYLREVAQNGKQVQMKDTFGKFTIDVVAAAAYGLQINSFKDPDSSFARMSKYLVDPGRLANFMVFFFFLVPNIAKHFGNPFLPAKAVEYFSDLTLSTIKHREENGIKRKDFLQMMADARKGELKDDEENNRENHEQKKGKQKYEMSDLQVITQGFTFFFAGYETLSNVLTFTAYELAIHQDIQDKVRDEIQRVLEEHNNDITYETIQKMEYLDMVLNEISRIHPSLTRNDRTCTKDYKVPGTDYTIEKGTVISFSLAGMSYDPDYFPNPEIFDPERFSKEEKAKRNPYCFQPFGTGPRACIGTRFALMEMKGILVKILSEMKLVPCEKTQIPLEVFTPQGLLKAKDGVWLKVEKLQ